MVSGTSASLCWILLFTVSASEGKIITAEPGETVTLPCQAPRNTTFQVVEWIRRDLNNLTVCVYRGKCENIDSSFKDRVQMNNDRVKNGDVSLILKNVMINDTGAYECRVRQRESKRRKRDVEHVESIVYMTVSNSGGGAGVGLGIGLGVVVLFVIGGVVVFALKRKGFIKVNSDDDSASKPDDQQQI